MKERVVSCIVSGLFAALCVSLFFNYKQYRDLRERPDKVEVTTTVTTNEKTVREPEPKNEREVGRISVPVKKVSEKEREISSDSTEVSEALELVGDSIVIPITQKVYEDSLFTAWLSGYQHNLDSIKVKEKIVSTTVTETRTDTEFRRWNIGLTAGYGYGINGRKPDFFVGVGVTYNLFPEKKSRLRR